jgi:RNA polymerase sigma-70 factor (ECF subfamily)
MNPTLPHDEEQWIAQAVAGDMLAFRALYDRYRGRVVAQVGRMIGPGADVDDVTQDVFVQVYRSLATFQGNARFSTWLWRITWNVTANHLRKTRKPVDMYMLRQLSAEPDTWNRLEARDLNRILGAALDQIGDDAREAFVLYEVEGLSLQEIADLTEQSLNTIASRVRRTRERLSTLLLEATEGNQGTGGRER